MISSKMKNSNDPILFHTRCIYYEPIDKNINILLQDLNGPCMLIAIINALILQGKIELKKSQYTSELLNQIIKARYPDAPDLSLLLNGFNINPYFSDCTKFKDYPAFLDSLGIKMVHSMVCDPRDECFPYIADLEYEAFQIELVEISEGKMNSQEKIDAFNKWNEKIQKQTTRYGTKHIKSKMKENEIFIYFRGNHFSVITKHNSNIYALLTDEIFAMTNCIWESIPDENGESIYYDLFFRPLEEISSSSNASSAELINSLIYQNENGSGNINEAAWNANLQKSFVNPYRNVNTLKNSANLPPQDQYRNKFNQWTRQYQWDNSKRY